MKKPTVLPLTLWLSIILALALLFHPKGVLADALAEARTDDVRVVLYTEECALKSQIENLPRRATWEEGGKLFEGFWTAYKELGLVVAYFNDKTVALISVSALVKVRSS